MSLVGAVGCGLDSQPIPLIQQHTFSLAGSKYPLSLADSQPIPLIQQHTFSLAGSKYPLSLPTRSSDARITTWQQFSDGSTHPEQGGGSRFIDSQTRPLHANEGDQTTRNGTSPQPPRRLEVSMNGLAYHDELPNLQDSAGVPRS